MSYIDPFSSPVKSESPLENDQGGVLPTLKVENVGLIFNPISGRGRSRLIAENVRHSLQSDALSVEVLESQRQYDPVPLQARLRNLDLALIVGGDGTLSALLPHLSASGTPVYMIPAGNESLFSRAFDMKSDFGALSAAIRAGVIEKHSFGMVNETPFFTMTTVGIDSLVIDTISSYRTGPIGHVGYVWPTLKHLMSYVPPTLSIVVDGKQIVSDEPGYLIIANSPHYALGLNLVPEAHSQSRELCARFFPRGDIIRLLTLATGRFCGMTSALDGSILMRGDLFEVNCSNSAGYPIQGDGEAMGRLPARIALGSGEISVLRGV